jgi:hypothetical protein
LSVAVNDGYNIGSQNAAINDFNHALEKALEEAAGNDKEASIDNAGNLIIKYTQDFDNYFLIQNLANKDEIEDELLGDIGYNFNRNFYEPQYGWQEFDKDAFNDYIIYYIDDYI